MQTEVYHEVHVFEATSPHLGGNGYRDAQHGRSVGYVTRFNIHGTDAELPERMGRAMQRERERNIGIYIHIYICIHTYDIIYAHNI